MYNYFQLSLYWKLSTTLSSFMPWNILQVTCILVLSIRTSPLIFHGIPQESAAELLHTMP